MKYEISICLIEIRLLYYILQQDFEEKTIIINGPSQISG